MLDDSEHASIVNSVLGLARSFERHTLAEGVETEAHGQVLVELGCEMAQGYAIARPMPADAVPAWLMEWEPPVSWQTTPALEPAEVPLLLAEVEHRAWLKALKAHLAGKQDTPPPLGSDACRFGGWLNKASTRRRYGLLPEFEQLHSLHEEVHQLGHTLVQAVRGPLNAATAPPEASATGPASAPASAHIKALWQMCQLRSAELLNALRGMRHTPGAPASMLVPEAHT